MFIRKNLGATYAGSCDGVAPGSFMWDARGCAARAAPAPASASIVPTTAKSVPSAYTQPGTYMRPPPPAPVIVTVDNAGAQRAEQEYNARLRAQMAETEAQRARSAAESAALKAQQEADILRAQSNSGLVDWEGGAATYANAGGHGKTGAPVATNNEAYLWLALLATAGFVLTRKKK